MHSIFNLETYQTVYLTENLNQPHSTEIFIPFCIYDSEGDVPLSSKLIANTQYNCSVHS